MKYSLQSRLARRIRFFAYALPISGMLVTQSVSAREFIEIATPNFTVVSALSEKDTVEYIEQLNVFERAVADFTTISDAKPRAPLRIYLVGSLDWDKNVKATELMAGFVSPQPFGTVAALNAQMGESSRKFLFHEYVHFLVRNTDVRNYPAWFDEGVAELLSTVEIVRTKITIGKPPAERLLDLADVGGASWVPLREVLTSRPKNEDDKPSGHGAILGFYAESWALMHYLAFEHPSGSKSLGRYLTMVDNKVPMEEAFTDAFAMSIEEMDSLLKRYVERSKYRIVTGDTTKMSVRPMTLVSVRQLSPLESRLELGQLMMRTRGKPQKIPELYDSILKSFPKNPSALAGKANALALLEKFTEADTSIAQALELAPTNQDVLVMAGDIESLRIGAMKERNEQTEALRTKMFKYYDEAMILPFEGPEAFETIVRYARLVDERGASPNRALMQLGYIRREYPTQPYAAVIHARLLAKTGKLAQARDAWQIAAHFGQGSLREMAAKELAEIESQLQKM